jgi:hypothetical protein
LGDRLEGHDRLRGKIGRHELKEAPHWHESLSDQADDDENAHTWNSRSQQRRVFSYEVVDRE